MQFDRLEPGEHLACFYDTVDECQTVIKEFAEAGIARAERVVVLAGAQKQSDFLPIDFQSADELSGDCRPAAISWLEDQIDLTRRQGCNGLRVLLDAKALPMQPTEMVELETALSRTAREQGVLIVCLFDRRYFSAEVLFDLVAAHKKNLFADHLVETICFSEDISHHLMIERALRKSEERYRNLVENQGEGVVILNAEMKIEFANLAAGYIMGTLPEGLVGRNLNEFLVPGQELVISYQMRLRQMGKVSTYELAVVTLDERQRQLLVTATTRFDSTGKFNGSFAVFRDITERKDREERLRYQATHDLLTGLHNRAYFEEQLSRMEHNRRKPASIIVVDLDNLKQVNDRFGHLAGDELLRQVANLLQSTFRAQDIVSRLGGDEFTVLMPDTDSGALSQALARLERLQRKLQANPGRPLVQYSYGGATAGVKDSLLQAFQKADEQMYHHKRAKKIA